jgi:predicted O-methyltransferase YrrM
VDTMATVRKAVTLMRQPRRALSPLRALLSDPEVYHAVGAWNFGALPRVPVADVLPDITDLDVRLTRFIVAEGAPTVLELATICGLVRNLRATRVLEIGTSDGGTTLSLAANLPEDGIVTTVDLPADWKGNVTNHVGSVVGRRFRDRNCANIRQVFGDSTALDWSTFGGPFDLIFVDGGHEYDVVCQDSVNARRQVRPGGLVVWHDYGVIEGVSRAVDEIGGARGVIRGTSLAFAVD